MPRHEFRLSIISTSGAPRECVPPGRSFKSDTSSSRVRTNFSPRLLKGPALRLAASPTSASNTKNPEERRNGGRGPHIHTRFSFLEVEPEGGARYACKNRKESFFQQQVLLLLLTGAPASSCLILSLPTSFSPISHKTPLHIV